MFEFLFKIFIDYYGDSNSKRFTRGKRILEIGDKNNRSVLLKAAVKNKLEIMNILIKQRHMLKESDLSEILRFYEGDQSTKLGSSKMSKRLNNVDQLKFITLHVNKIWDYLKDKNASKLKTYIETRAEVIKEANPDLKQDEVYSKIVDDQKKPTMFTPLHFAIKYQNLRVIRMLVNDYKADTTLEDRNGHDVFEYLHMGDVNHSKFKLV